MAEKEYITNALSGKLVYWILFVFCIITNLGFINYAINPDPNVRDITFGWITAYGLTLFTYTSCKKFASKSRQRKGEFLFYGTLFFYILLYVLWLSGISIFGIKASRLPEHISHHFSMIFFVFAYGETLKKDSRFYNLIGNIFEIINGSK